MRLSKHAVFFLSLVAGLPFVSAQSATGWFPSPANSLLSLIGSLFNFGPFSRGTLTGIFRFLIFITMFTVTFVAASRTPLASDNRRIAGVLSLVISILVTVAMPVEQVFTLGWWGWQIFIALLLSGLFAYIGYRIIQGIRTAYQNGSGWGVAAGIIGTTVALVFLGFVVEAFGSYQSPSSIVTNPNFIETTLPLIMLLPKKMFMRKDHHGN